MFLSLFAIPLYRIRLEHAQSLAQGEVVPLWLGLLPMLYVGLPIGAGTLIGYGLRQGWRWAEVLTGPDPAPRAWDHLFQYKSTVGSDAG